MNPRLVTLTVALVLAIAAMVSLKRTSAPLFETTGTEEASPASLPSKTERIDHDHHPDRLLGLDPSLHQIAIRLEKGQISWEHNRPLIRGGHADRNDWFIFALAQAGQLETSQIEALINWLEIPNNDYVTEVWQYRQAFYQTWASRDPDGARDHVIALAADYDVLSPEQKKLRRNPYLDDAEDMYHFALAGSAIHDAPKAWATFQRDLANPAIRNLPNASVTTQEIFKAYASQAPAEAWGLVLTEPVEKLVSRMLEGYADGAPAGHDWEALGAEFVQSLESRGLEAQYWAYESIATRWVTEDPVAALDWYAAQETVFRDDPDDPFASSTVLPSDVPRPPEVRQQLKIDLLKDMYRSHKDLTTEVVAVLDQLLAGGDTELVTNTLTKLTGGYLSSFDIPLLEVIPQIPDPEIRNETFLQFVMATPPRDPSDPFGPGSSLDEPNIAYEAVRDLADRLDLPADIRAQAEAAFRRIEEEEALNRAKMKNDPFAPE